jgi:uncharacterized membrane protein YgcG
MLGFHARTRQVRLPALAAAIAAVIVLALAVGPGSAPARPYMPPGGHIFEGVSDMGNKNDYFRFQKAVKRHVAVMQSFEVWGGDLKESKQRWKRTETRGLLSLSTSPCYGCKEVISPRAIATGKGDAYLLRLNAFLADWGKPTYIRLLPEMNGHWNPYAAFNEDGSSRGPDHKTVQFRRAWRRVVLIVRGGPRAQVNRKLRREHMPPIKLGSAPKRLKRTHAAFIWCPQTAGSPSLRKNRPAAYWPGAGYVDWVGADIYGKYPNFSGLERFYKQRKNFPFMIGEWSPWDYDNPGFVNQLHEWGESHKRVHMLVYYQGFGADNPFLIQHYPRSKRALRKQLDNKRYMRYAPHSARPGDAGHGDGGHHHGGGGGAGGGKGHHGGGGDSGGGGGVGG